jgi:DNA-binding NtrC family response regulator
VTHALSTIFVVDDEPSVGTALVAILALKGFEAQCFTSPLKALEVARSVPPDILVPDVMMPDICGIVLAILMTREFPKCQVLLFSGMANTSDWLKTAHEKGHNSRLLSKPFAPR